ncbi:MAG: tRNA pseudouridine(55) synthase TruB [Clostridia bacterium]|nr:tRNA pseudouridine(55) synthase TruB [Clostridia bacterium]
MKREIRVNTFGFINVDKPSGITSSAIVNKIKWLAGVPCGHMGTLDPLASGVLPVGVGNATRLFDYFLQKQKTYIAEFTFGETSDTLDCTGEIVRGGHVPNESKILSVLPKFIGEIDQIPPKYSAKNVNGKRGYDLARAGIEFELPPKRIIVHGIEFLGRAEGKENAFNFKIDCSGGTYIRSLARDIATACGTQGLMSALRRTKSGIFTLENAIQIEELTEQNIQERVIPTDMVLPFPVLELTSLKRDKIFDGVAIPTDYQDGEYKFYRDGKFYGIAEVKNGKAKIKTKLC